jgi:hypothetical protein
MSPESLLRCSPLRLERFLLRQQSRGEPLPFADSLDLDSDLTQQCRFHITSLSVSYQSASSILTEGQISDQFAERVLTIGPISRISPLL